MSYPVIALWFAFFMISLSILAWYQRTQWIDKLTPLWTFLSLGFSIIAIMSALSGLMYATEYVNSAPCENLLNYTQAIDLSPNLENETINYFYTSSCASRPTYDLGNYVLNFIITTSLFLVLLIMYGLIMLFGRKIGQW